MCSLFFLSFFNIFQIQKRLKWEKIVNLPVLLDSKMSLFVIDLLLTIQVQILAFVDHRQILFYLINIEMLKTVLITILVLQLVLTLDNGVGRTPPMGWNTWNRYACNINESLIRQTADLLVSTGLADKGYKFLNLDDCWQIERNKTTQQIIEDKTKFPSGIAVLADYIHSKGLYFGLYSDAGFKTCEGRPGSLGYEQIDANTYAKWKVDYLKYDNCNNDGTAAKIRYSAMRDALNKTGRPIFYSICNWGQELPYIWGRSVGNSWRTTGDIQSTWDSFVGILDKQVYLSRYAAPGGWNDPDMLEVGNGLMTVDEYQSHFALWAALKAPLILGCGLSGIAPSTLKIISNEQVIAVNQDSMGIQADLILNEVNITGNIFRQVWGGPLSGNRMVYICFNRHSTATTFKLLFNQILSSTIKVTKVREIIDGVDVQAPQDNVLITKQVRSHAVAMYVITYQLR